LSGQKGGAGEDTGPCINQGRRYKE